MKPLTDYLNPNTIIFNNTVYSREQILAGIDTVAGYLEKHVGGSSPIVHLFCPNHIKSVFAYFGIIRSGRAAVLIDPKIGRLEYKEMREDSPPCATIRIDTASDTFDFPREIALDSNDLPPALRAECENVCTMVYTAAHDGYAKAAMLTHENMYADAQANFSTDKSDKSSTITVLLPLHYLFGMLVGIIAPMISGANIFLISLQKPQRLRSIVDVLEKYSVTHVSSVPHLFYLLLKVHNSQSKLKKVEYFSSGGYALPKFLFDIFRDRTGHEIHEGYGLTEAAPVCTWNHPDRPVKQGSVGTPFTCCRVKIACEDGTEAAAGETGEVCIDGANVMKGYFNNPAATNRALHEGWLHTGDLGYLDSDGYLFLTGLKKRMLNVGGKKVYPAEVERLIKQSGMVETVEIFGEYDQVCGDAVKARIAFKNDKEGYKELFLEWCKDTMSRYKIPSLIKLSI
jgi:long-chain acyl-CoA synthetase